MKKFIENLVYPRRCVFCSGFLDKNSNEDVCSECAEKLPWTKKKCKSKGEFFSECLSPLYYDGKAGEANAKAIIFGFWAMINEAIDIENDERAEKLPPLSLKQVGRIVSRAGLQNSAKTLNDAVIQATKEDTPKNA